jgi:glutathione S-transferase
MHPRPLSIAIERVIVHSHGGQTDEDKVKAAVAPVKTALEAIESLTVGHPYELGHELSIADFYLISVFTYLSQTRPQSTKQRVRKVQSCGLGGMRSVNFPV